MTADLSALIEISRVYAELGSAITDQLDEVTQAWYQGEDAFEEAVCNCNINALGYVRRYLEDVERLGGDMGDEARELNEALAAKEVPVLW